MNVAGPAELLDEDDGWEEVSDATRALRDKLVYSKPLDIPWPECCPEPDGALSVDWIRSHSQLVSVSVREDYNGLPYCYLDGGIGGGCGVIVWDKENFPQELADMVRRIVMEG